jgi:hypothetical protein
LTGVRLPSLADFVFLLVYSRASQRKGGKRILFQKGFFLKKKELLGRQITLISWCDGSFEF